ncbi:MAG: hypothetical protein J6X88_07330 [Bacteroidales bacterium]|nr:hypothetical protein [Bacteroidales bacterium]
MTATATLTHSSVSRADSSPNLGEQLEIQLAPANSSPMRVVSSGDHEGNEVKSPRSRQLLSSEPSSCFPGGPEECVLLS